MKVSVNPPKTPVTKGSNGVATATVPNVCKMPGPPAPFVPTPLPNIGKSGDSPKGYTKKVTVEGHADSRGTNEYNLALAERRASAVRDYLVSLGLAADRVTIVSLGEEQPACSEETEACWQKNRRGHFRFTAK